MILIFLIFFLNVFSADNENKRKLEIYCNDKKIFEHNIYKEPFVHYYSIDAIGDYFYLRKEGEHFEITEDVNYWEPENNDTDTKTTFVFKVFDNNSALLTTTSLPLLHIDFIRCSIYPTIKKHGKKKPFGTKVEIVKYTPKTKLRKNMENILGFIGVALVSLCLGVSLSVSLQHNGITKKNANSTKV